MQKINISLIAGIICCLMYEFSSAQSGNSGFIVEAMGSIAIPLTTNKMTNIVFPVAIRPGIKVSRDVTAQQPKGTTNVLVLKAARKGFAPTNLSIYGVDGRLYSFELTYVQDPPVLNFKVHGDGVAIKMPLAKNAESIEQKKAFMRQTAGIGKMQLILQGIYLQDSLMWFSLLLRNQSAIEFFPETVRWLVRDSKQLKRTAVQEIVLRPAFETPVRSVPGNSLRVIVAGFRPFMLMKDKVLTIQVAEKNGGRMLTLRVGQKTLLRSKPEKSEE